MAATVVLFLSVILCMTPLGFYLVGLSRLHRQSQVIVWTGRGDFLALLAGLSGFLFVLGGAWLFAFQSNLVFLLRGNSEQWWAVYNQERWLWLGTAAAYLLLLAGPVLATLSARQRTLAVYNLDWQTLEPLIHQVLSELGLSASRLGTVWSDGRPILQAEPSWTTNYATIRWLSSDDRLAEEFGIHLREKCTKTLGSGGPIALWLQTAGLSCLGVAFVAVLLNLYYLYLVRGY